MEFETKKLQGGDLEDTLPPSPIPPYTTDMLLSQTSSLGMTVQMALQIWHTVIDHLHSYN